MGFNVCSWLYCKIAINFDMYIFPLHREHAESIGKELVVDN